MKEKTSGEGIPVDHISRSDRSPEPDERYVRSRIEDRSPWAKVSYYMDLYKPLVWLVSILAIAMGFGFATPAQKFGALEGEIQQQRKERIQMIDSLAARQDAALRDRKDQRLMLEFMLRDRCVTLTDKELRRLGGVEICENAFNPARHASDLKIFAPGDGL